MMTSVMNRIIHQEITVSYQYPVVFTRDVFNPANTRLYETLHDAVEQHSSPSMLVFVDDGVAVTHPGLVDSIARYMRHHLPAVTLCSSPVIIPGGESIKSNRPAIEKLLEKMADARLDRHSYVMAIGGGAVLDAVGYAASLVHRGVRLIRVPTTVLSQNDAGVGVKTAINDVAGKNFLGTFAPPFAVINDADFLKSLPDETWRGGIAEAFKVALIKDAVFFEWLCASARLLSDRDESVMEELVFRCADLHLKHIRQGGDPFEMGQARPLDFGHWSAHQLEVMTEFEVGHGQAVAIGIMLDTGLLNNEDADRLFGGLSTSGFSLWHDALEQRDPSGRLSILAGIEKFREHLGGRLCVTMPSGLGSSCELHALDEAWVQQAIKELRERTATVHS
jgi:3-dehydroquinate synthase